MAIVKSPLFSLGASGQLGNALVFFPFKGLNVVRTHVIPANPNTQAQQTQRGYMGDAVDEWHGASYTDADRTAWNRWATTLGAGLSGFNAFCRSFITGAVAGNTWTRLHNLVASGIDADTIVIDVTKVSGGDAPVMHYGVSPTFMPNTAALSDQTGNDWKATVNSLTSKTRYYFYVDVGTPGDDYARTGVYLATTL